MGNDDKVLSQSEIDALLASSLAKGNAPAAKVSSPPPPAVNPVKAPVTPLNTASTISPPKVAAPVPPPAKMAAPPVPPKPAAHMPAAAPVPKGVPVNMPAPPPQPMPAPQPVVHHGLTAEQVSSLCRQVVAEQTRDLSKQVLELTVKINKMDNMSQKISRLEELINQLNAAVQSSPQATQALGMRVDELYKALGSFRKQHADEERIHEQFKCIKCHSEKLVAVHVKCTNCGMENWMGWFPDSTKNSISGSYQP